MQELAAKGNPLFGRIKFSVFRTRAQCAHGPQTWPWWRIASFRCNHLVVCLPSTGRGFWIYTRWGAIALDLVIDRRAMITPKP